MTSSAPIDFCNARSTTRRLIHTLCCNTAFKLLFNNETATSRVRANSQDRSKVSRGVRKLYRCFKHRAITIDTVSCQNFANALRPFVEVGQSAAVLLQLSNGCDCTDGSGVLSAVLDCTIWLYILYFVHECTAMDLRRFGFTFRHLLRIADDCIFVFLEYYCEKGNFLKRSLCMLQSVLFIR